MEKRELENIAKKEGKLDNCITAWELYKKYGIKRAKTTRAIREGKLNAFMLGTDKTITLKWYIEKDELFEQYINKNKVEGFEFDSTKWHY